MVIDKFLRVNTSQDPKVEELRQRLAALQQKAQSANQSPPVQAVQQATAVPNKPVVASTATPTQPRLDAQVQAMAPRIEPELRLREERTTNLIMNQIKELITLHTEASKRIKELENHQVQVDKELETFRDKHEDLLQKMNTIDSRLEKFMGLYELVTNQYNPFANAPAPKPSQPVQRQVLPPQDTVLQIEDNITKQSSAVPVSRTDQEKAMQNFKRVEEMLADLQKQHEEKNPPTTAPPGLNSELHALLAGFEDRLQLQFDKSLQEKLHQGFANLEQGLQQEIRDAMKAELANLQQDDKGVQSTLNELQELLQAAEAKNRQPVEDELSELTSEIERLQDEVKTIPPNLYFRVADGTILKDLPDLKLCLRRMTPDTFARHFSTGRNDFADWVEHALELTHVSQRMRQATNQQELIQALS